MECSDDGVDVTLMKSDSWGEGRVDNDDGVKSA